MENANARAPSFCPDLLERNIEDLKLPPRTERGLAFVGIITIGDLLACTEWRLSRIPNFGRVSLRCVRQALAQRGLRLALEIPPRPRTAGQRLVPEEVPP
jgi:DNA-directed RNA polymerase alpha subunit